MGNLEKVGVRIVRQFFCLYLPKIRSFLNLKDLKAWIFSRPKKPETFT